MNNQLPIKDAQRTFDNINNKIEYVKTQHLYDMRDTFERMNVSKLYGRQEQAYRDILIKRRAIINKLSDLIKETNDFITYSRDIKKIIDDVAATYGDR